MKLFRWFVVAFLLMLAAAVGSAVAIVAARGVVRDVFRPRVTYTVDYDGSYVRVSQRDNVEPEVRLRHRGPPTIRVWQDYLLRAGETAPHVMLVSGDATIEGRIEGDLIVLLGSARLASTAIINGSLVVVAGSVTVGDGAVIYDDLVVVGGVVQAPPGFAPRHEHIVIGATALGDRMRAVVPWITRGLLWGRLIVPDLGWVWGIALLVLIVSLAVNLLLHAPVGAAAGILAAKPFSTFLTGLLVLLLIGPVSVLLAASIIGLAVVPFLLCALVVAWIAGRVAVARAIGRAIVSQDAPESRLQAMRSVAIGFAALCLLYLVPVVGLITWAMVGVFGLGAASLAFVAALRRERPSPPVPVAPRPPAPPPPAPIADVPLAPPPMPTPGPAAAVATGAVAHDLTWLPRATFLDRAAAFALDVAFILVLVGLSPLDRHDDSAPFLVAFMYLVGFWAWKGTTLGGIVCNVRLTRVDGQEFRFADAFVRGLASILSIVALGIGCLWILRDPENQAWHDKIAGTYVVRVPRSWPLP